MLFYPPHQDSPTFREAAVGIDPLDAVCQWYFWMIEFDRSIQRLMLEP